MKVVLKEDFPSLGYVGETVSVKPGYARNFLVPRGIAVEAASRKAKELQHRLSAILAKKAKLKKEAEAKKSQLEGLILEFTLKVGKGGKSFGSISLKNIEEELHNKGFSFDRRQLRLVESIKSGGSFALEIKLHSEVTARATVRVIVERDTSAASQATEASDAAESSEQFDDQGEGLEASAGDEGDNLSSDVAGEGQNAAE